MSGTDLIKKIVINSGNVLKERYFQSFSYNAKGRYDLVSEVDLEIEELLISNLKSIDSKASYYSEEYGSITNASTSRWIIDPIDGTANFIFGVPYFNISLSLEAENRIVEAYVYNPITGELYHTGPDNNLSYLNDRIIHVSPSENIADSLVVFGFSANYANISRYYSEWQSIFTGCKKGMGLLSPALNICNVARGRTNCFIDFGSNMEGHAGAALILKKAGGAVLNYDMSEWDYTTKGILAGVKGIVDKLKKSRK